MVVWVCLRANYKEYNSEINCNREGYILEMQSQARHHSKFSRSISYIFSLAGLSCRQGKRSSEDIRGGVILVGTDKVETEKQQRTVVRKRMEAAKHQNLKATFLPLFAKGKT